MSRLTALLFFSGGVGFETSFLGLSSTSFTSTSMTSGDPLSLLVGVVVPLGKHVCSSSKNFLVNLSFFTSGLSLSFELVCSSKFLFSAFSGSFSSSFEFVSSKCLNILGDFVFHVSFSGVFLFSAGGGVQGGVIGDVGFMDKSRGSNGSL